MVAFAQNYLAAGANRHPAPADWDTNSGILAYGSDRNIALWKPLVVNYMQDANMWAYFVDRIMENQA